MCTHFIALSYPLSPTPPLSPLGRTCSALLFSDFVGEKKEKIK
jgi:hypothetical protein